MKKLPYTPNSRIRSVLRQLFLRSRERAAALKRDKYTCRCCGIKQSRAKGKVVFVEVHHLEGILNWDALFESVRKYLLCNPDLLVTMCEKCHKAAESRDKTQDIEFALLHKEE